MHDDARQLRRHKPVIIDHLTCDKIQTDKKMGAELGATYGRADRTETAVDRSGQHGHSVRMRKLTLLLSLAVVGCAPTQQEVFQQNATDWLGQPVRSFAEAKGLVPVSIDNRPGGKAFMYQVAVAGRTCGVTVLGEMRPGDPEYMISGIYSPCDSVAVRRRSVTP